MFKIRNRRIVMKSQLLVLLPLALLPVLTQAQPMIPLKQRLQTMTNVNFKDMQKQTPDITTLQVSVLLPNKNQPLDFVAGTQKKQSAKAATTAMMVQYGSITKAFTSTLLIKAIKQHGKINHQPVQLITTLGTIFPNKFYNKRWPKQWKTVSITQLLNMTSGITTTFNNIDIMKNVNMYAKYTLNQYVHLAAHYQKYHGCIAKNQCFIPGSRYGYSNTNYMIAGIIVEKIYQQPFAKVFRNMILRNFHHKIFYRLTYNERMRKRMLHGYADAKLAAQFNPLKHQDNFFPHQDVTNWPLYLAGPAGALTGSTHALTLIIRDLFKNDRWGVANDLMRYGFVRADNGKKVHYRDINKQCTNSTGFCYGLGVVVIYQPGIGQVWYYQGGTPGYITQYYWFKKKNIIIAFSYNTGADFDFHYSVLDFYHAVENLDNTHKHPPHYKADTLLY